MKISPFIKRDFKGSDRKRHTSTATGTRVNTPCGGWPLVTHDAMDRAFCRLVSTAVSILSCKARTVFHLRYVARSYLTYAAEHPVCLDDMHAEIDHHHFYFSSQGHESVHEQGLTARRAASAKAAITPVQRREGLSFWSVLRVGKPDSASLLISASNYLG